MPRKSECSGQAPNSAYRMFGAGQMNDLTQRQIDILKFLIEEYIETAEAVGSETLEKKYNLSASPATIRNEMVKLTNLGYLRKAHSSSGRIPTPLGMKFYVKQLMKEKELSIAEEVAVKERLWDFRGTQRLMKELTNSLSEKTGALAIAATSDGGFYASGQAKILEMPEFFDIDITRNLLGIIDEFDYLTNIFSSSLEEEEDIHILLGEELGPKLQAGLYGLVFTHFEGSNNLSGDLGVLGPVRLNYNYVIPTLRCFRNMLEEALGGKK